MATDRELLQMALDALNNFDKGNHGMRWQVPVIKALRARLAQPEPEPVAWISHNAGLYHGKPDESLNPLPLYTTTPQREVYCGCGDEIVAGDGARCGTCVAVKFKEKEWVGLNPKEISEIAFLCRSENPSFFAHEVEAKLKEKNYD